MFQGVANVAYHCPRCREMFERAEQEELLGLYVTWLRELHMKPPRTAYEIYSALTLRRVRGRGTGGGC